MSTSNVARHHGALAEVFLAFLKLGMTSFGGPVAHLGYFRNELVIRRRWIDEAGYADLIALCQFLPGPASSQVGFALGLMRGGLRGALLAWLAFTLPSALLLLMLAFSADTFAGPWGGDIIHGLKLVAVAVVAQAVWGMAPSLCPDRRRAAIAVAAVLIVTFATSPLGQITAILAGALGGLMMCRHLSPRPASQLHLHVPRRTGIVALGLFLGLLVGLPLITRLWPMPGLALFEAFYRPGALVFGGGHVVLPLLESSVVNPGWVTQDDFLAGYGAAQAVPGPLFTVAAYLGGIAAPLSSSVVSAGVALVAIFLPGLLLLVGVLPFWNELRQRLFAQALIAGTNAAVVGILAAALYDPVWTSAVRTPTDFAIVLVAFLLLTLWKVPPWLVVLVTILGSLIVAAP